MLPLSPVFHYYLPKARKITTLSNSSSIPMRWRYCKEILHRIYPDGAIQAYIDYKTGHDLHVDHIHVRVAIWGYDERGK
jgi:hypothetical protein